MGLATAVLQPGGQFMNYTDYTNICSLDHPVPRSLATHPFARGPVTQAKIYANF